MKTLLFLCFFTSNLFAFEMKYVYHPEWKVLYTFDNKNRVKKINSPHEWKVPNTDCIVGPVQYPSKTRFFRQVACNGEIVGKVDCTVSNKTKTRCEKDFGKVVLILKIKRFPTMGSRRKMEAEFERKNVIPY